MQLINDDLLKKMLVGRTITEATCYAQVLTLVLDNGDRVDIWPESQHSLQAEAGLYADWIGDVT